jgi:hypothetical protein
MMLEIEFLKYGSVATGAVPAQTEFCFLRNIVRFRFSAL